ncbi:hypothetical protein AB0N05_14960 [Nocardia sp. NPDC051030]|uniref:hypothetical protein n=1 Tax=Nocardia sp. NPDC051030 TaxID=3155162 RepID=UPI003412EBED
MPELFVGAEGLTAGAPEVLGTLLHQAAHGIARARGVAESSDNGRYHNKKFKILAEEVGLVVARHQRFGWSLTTVPNATARRYHGEINLLSRAIVAHRRPEHDAADTDSVPADPDTTDNDHEDGERGDRSRDRNGRPLLCQCRPPRRIRAHKKIIDAGPILCGVCRTQFTA